MAKNSRKSREALEAQRFVARVEALGGEVVRYDAPHDWTEQVIDAGGLTPESTDREIEEAATEWAQSAGHYADPDGEEV